MYYIRLNARAQHVWYCNLFSPQKHKSENKSDPNNINSFEMTILVKKVKKKKLQHRNKSKEKMTDISVKLTIVGPESYHMHFQLF